MKTFFYLPVLLLLVHPQSFGQDLVQEMVNAVSTDSVMATISKLASFGTRYESTPQRDSAASYLLGEFTRLGLSAESDWYSFGTVTLYDIATTGTGRLFMTASSGVLLASTDNGEHWTTVATPAKNALTAIAFASTQTGCIAGYGELLRTVDGGNTWSSIFRNSGGVLSDIGFVNETLGIIVCNWGVILRTTDAGVHWASIPSGTTAHLQSLKIVNASNIWVAGTSDTLLHSSDGGATWVLRWTGHFGSFSGIEFSTPLRGWAVSATGSKLISTTDGGMTWAEAPLPSTNEWVGGRICFQDSLHGWIQDYRKVFRTTDGGQSWSLSYKHASESQWGPDLRNISLLPGSRIAVYGDQGTILTTDDGGASWQSRTTGLPDSLLHTSRNIVATLPGTVSQAPECVLVAHYDSYCYNADRSLTAPGANDNASGVSAVLEAARIARNYRFACTLRFVAVSAEEQGMIGSNHYALQAFNDGCKIKGVVNADMIGNPTTTDMARLVLSTYLAPNHLLDSAIAVNQRHHLGITLTTCLDNTAASDYGPFAVMGFDALNIAEGSANDIWLGADPYYHTRGDTAGNIHPGLVRLGTQLMLAVAANLARDTVMAREPEVPQHFVLEQNYPNPFNPKTAIRFQVPGVSYVKLLVFDLLGREVTTLVSAQKTAGSYEVSFDGSGLATGVYIYRLTAGSFAQARKMIVLK